MTVKMAVPNKGRLNERAVELITKAGIYLGDDWGRKLNIKVPDLDLEVFFIRAQDIPIFIESGAVDFGITGQDVAAEAGVKIKKIMDLEFGRCRLAVAAPEDSKIALTGKLTDGVRIATSFPKLTKKYCRELGIKADIVFVQGAAEIMPQLGVSDAIADLVATGSTLRMNRLKEISTILESEASVFASEKSMADPAKKEGVREITDAIRSVLDAEDKKYLMADVPKKKLDEVARIIPGIGGPTVLSLAGNDDLVAVQAVIDGRDVYKVIGDLKKIGSKGILTVPIERLVE